MTKIDQVKKIKTGTMTEITTIITTKAVTAVNPFPLLTGLLPETHNNLMEVDIWDFLQAISAITDPHKTKMEVDIKVIPTITLTMVIMLNLK